MHHVMEITETFHVVIMSVLTTYVRSRDNRFRVQDNSDPKGATAIRQGNI
jgi:hypothetical protein